MPLKENRTIVKRTGDKSKVYSHEDYAQELYNLVTGFKPTVSKDLCDGEILRVVDFRLRSEGEVEAVCSNHDSLFFSIKKERKFFEIMGFDEHDFKSWVLSKSHVDYLEKNKINIQVENRDVRKGSLYHAHLMTIVEEFKEQISKPSMAYVGKIIDKNQGGFIVEVQGMKTFMPGSLAAANKITDFDNYIGKEINVMIEDYLASSDIFVVSYKKYLDYILPSKLGELERDQVMEGTVTGTSKYGIFVEFDDIFTGLLHTAEMSPETSEKFSSFFYKPGMRIKVWLKDIKDNKLILTEIDPQIKKNELEVFREKIEGNVKTATIVSIKAHGALMEIEPGVVGLLPLKEMKKSGRKLTVGESFDIFIKRVDTSTGKIYLTLKDEHATAEV